MQSLEDNSLFFAGLTPRLARGGEISKPRSPTRDSPGQPRRLIRQRQIRSLHIRRDPNASSRSTRIRSQYRCAACSRRLDCFLLFADVLRGTRATLQHAKFVVQSHCTFVPVGSCGVPTMNVHASVARLWSVAMIPSAQGNLHPAWTTLGLRGLPGLSVFDSAILQRSMKEPDLSFCATAASAHFICDQSYKAVRSSSRFGPSYEQAHYRVVTTILRDVVEIRSIHITGRSRVFWRSIYPSGQKPCSDIRAYRIF